jgi:hypothetical protein
VTEHSDSKTRPRYTNAAVVGTEHARATWALAAREKLVEAARSYHSVISYQELADFVQQRTLVRTDQAMRYWIGDVLTRVGLDCAQRGEPLLPALCVNAAGSVGAGYVAAVERTRGEAPAEPDDHAAHERLACHRHFGAELPEGGGVPALAPELEAKRSRARAPRSTSSGRTASARPSRAAAKAPEKPLEICPVHFTQLPATGVCDLCE